MTGRVRHLSSPESSEPDHSGPDHSGPDRVTLGLAGLLIGSGLFHLGWWFASGQSWEGAVSLRKPALFGISSGLTVWSLGWVLSCLQPRSRDRWWSQVIGWCLLCEVGLITLQFWRGVPSHFNHATALDRAIELVMLILILLVTLLIGSICVRSFQPIARSPSMVLAIRAGLFLLLVSCWLGIGTTVLGQINLASGKPAELWGKAGVLKFPHGMALHAIQLLPMCAWLFERWRLPRQYLAMQGLIAAQVCLLLYALWQTVLGRSRFDFDAVGASLLVLAGISLIIPLVWNTRHGRAAT